MMDGTGPPYPWTTLEPKTIDGAASLASLAADRGKSTRMGTACFSTSASVQVPARSDVDAPSPTSSVSFVRQARSLVPP